MWKSSDRERARRLYEGEELYQDRRISAEEIANLFGVTKDAIMGLAWRGRWTPYDVRREIPKAKPTEPRPEDPTGCRYILSDVSAATQVKYCNALIGPNQYWCEVHQAIIYRRRTIEE